MPPLALCAALWTAIALYRGKRPLRHLAGLALGALLARWGWIWLALPAPASRPGLWLEPGAGFSALFLPLGPLVAGAGAASFATLPLALAVARLGCLAAGCCHGASGEPLPLLEIGACLGLHFAVARLPRHRLRPVVLAGLALERGMVEPWRAPSPLGAPLVPVPVLVAAWLALAAALSLPRGRR